MTEDGIAPTRREQGWGMPLVGLLLLLVLPATPLLRIILPVEQALLLLVPALAMLAVAGWRAGGRGSLALMWAVLATWLLWQPGTPATDFALLARGWAAILAATFAALSIAGFGRSFLPRALVALVVAMTMSALVAVIASGGVAPALETFSAEIARRAAMSVAQWQEITASAEWARLVTANPEARVLGEKVDQQLVSAQAWAQPLLPSLLALQSLAAMALAWAVYHRVGRARLGPPLAPLRELRFDDALVWGIVAGVVIMVLPVQGFVRTIGINLLVLFGALYVLRGLGVILWFLAPGRWMRVFLVIFTLLFWHVVGMVAVVIGIGDTWFDWRRRLRPKTQRSE